MSDLNFTEQEVVDLRGKIATVEATLLSRSDIGEGLKAGGIDGRAVGKIIAEMCTSKNPTMKLRAVELLLKVARLIGPGGSGSGDRAGTTTHQQVGMHPNMQRLVLFANRLSPADRVELFAILADEEVDTIDVEHRIQDAATATEGPSAS